MSAYVYGKRTSVTRGMSGSTYVVQRRAMLSQLYHLDRDVLPDLQIEVFGHADLRQAELARVFEVVRAHELEGWNGRM